MKHIFSEEGRTDLARFAGSNVLLAFDYDGTLAPIAAHPDLARPRQRTRTLLDTLTRIYPCAVISGRGRSDALERLGNIQSWAASGNHGAEVLGRTEPYEEKVQLWGPVVREALADQAGVVIEDKRFSISIHYRSASDQRAAMAAIDAAVRPLEGARIMGGKRVVNVIPADAPHKGTALDCMRRWSACDTAIFVGDDVTDEDAFALPQEEVLSIRVGMTTATRARYFTTNQREVDQLLTALIELRERAARLQAPR